LLHAFRKKVREQKLGEGTKKLSTLFLVASVFLTCDPQNPRISAQEVQEEIE